MFCGKNAGTLHNIAQGWQHCGAIRDCSVTVRHYSVTVRSYSVTIRTYFLTMWVYLVVIRCYSIAIRTAWDYLEDDLMNLDLHSHVCNQI